MIDRVGKLGAESFTEDSLDMSTFDDIRNQADNPQGEPFDASPSPDPTAKLQSDSTLQRRTSTADMPVAAPATGVTVTDGTSSLVGTNPGNLPDVSISQYSRPYSMPDATYPGGDNTGANAALPIDQQRRPQAQEVYDGANHVNSPNFDNPISHLERAKELMRQGGVRAAEPEYFAAIRAADSIDQKEVARERHHVKEQLKHEKDPAKRRALVQEECMLHDMQRMPGAARANLAFAYLVTGHQPEGTRLMQEAAQLDPEMMKDPNWIRHMRSVQALYQPQVIPQQGDPRVNPGGVVRTPGSPSSGPMDNPGPGGGSNPGVTNPGDGTVRTPSGRRPGSDTTIPMPAGTVDTVPIPSGTNYVGSKDFADPIDDLSKATDALKAAGQMTPDVKALFKKAIQDADNIDRSTDPSDKKSIDNLEKQIAAQLGGIKPEDVPAKLTALTKEQSDMVSKLPKDKQDQLTALVKQLGAAKTEDDYNKVLNQMAAVSPDVVAKQKEIDKLSDGLDEYKQLEALRNSSILTRFAYEEALRKAGQNDEAKQVLGEMLKLDKTLAADEDVQNAAKALGVKLDSATPQSGPTDHTPTRQKPDAGPDAGDSSNSDLGGLKNKAGNDAMDLLQKAQDSLKKNGLNDETKKDFQDAIKSADALKGNAEAQALIDKHIKDLTALQKTAQSDDDKQKVSDALDFWNSMKNLPDQVRMMYAKAQYTAGDKDGAKATMADALKQDPDLAKDPVFQTYKTVMDSGKELSKDNLSNAYGQVSDPLQALREHEKNAKDLADKHQYASAENEFKAAIAAADNLPMDKVKAEIADLQKQRDKESDPAKVHSLTEQIEQDKAILQLPVAVRGDAAMFYVQNGKGDEAHAILGQIAKLDPTITHTDSYKALAQGADEASKGALAKAIDHAKGALTSLAIDGGAGTAGLTATNILSNILPEGKMFKVLAIGGGMLVGGGTHAGLSKAFGREVGWDSMAWGGVDTLAFLSGNEVRKGLNAAFDKSLTTERLADVRIGKEALLAEKNALTSKSVLSKVLGGEALSATDSSLLKGTLTKAWSVEEKGALDAALKGTASDAQKAILNSKLESAERIIQSTEKLRADEKLKLGDAHGLDGASKVTRMFEKELTDKRNAALKETLDTAFAERKANYAAKWGDKPILNWREPWQSTKRLWDSGSIQRTALELQAKTPIAWRFGETLSPFRAAQNEYLNARSGSFLRYTTPVFGDRIAAHMPWNALGKLETAPTLRSLEGRLFWRRFGVDAATAGAAGIWLEGAHNAEDWRTGKKTAGQAALDTVTGTAKDALVGGSVLSFFHGMGDTAAKVTGSDAPLAAPKPLDSSSSIWSRAAQPFRWSSYYGKQFFKAPEAYEPTTTSGKFVSSAASKFRGTVVDPVSNAGKWVSTSDSGLAKGLRATGTGFANSGRAYSPQIMEMNAANEKIKEKEALLQSLEKNSGPLKDENLDVPPQADLDKPPAAPDKQGSTGAPDATDKPNPVTPPTPNPGSGGKDSEDELPQ